MTSKQSGTLQIIIAIAIIALIFLAIDRRARTPKTPDVKPLAPVDLKAAQISQDSAEMARIESALGKPIASFEEDATMMIVLAEAMENDVDYLRGMRGDSLFGAKAKILYPKFQRAVSGYLPKMRQAYAKSLDKKMWEFDVEVAAIGGRKDILVFTGGFFAANKNKQEVQNSIESAVQQLRFKQVRYKWYQYDDQYTYYSFKDAKDEF